MLEVDDQTKGSGGILGSARRLLVSVTEFLATKLDLISLEFQEEKHQIVEFLCLAAAALLFGVLALLTFTATIIIFFWEDHKLAALVATTIIYFLLSLILFKAGQRKAKLASKLFETTVEELKKDIEWVKQHFRD